MSQKNVMIIGAGASGLVAAIVAARNGAKVTVLEHNEKPGKKIVATGNGKCNLTNIRMTMDAFRGNNTQIVSDVFEQFSMEDTVKFFQELGIFFTDKNGYLYPRSGQASSVTDVLCMEAGNLGVKIKTNEHVTALIRTKDGWSVQTESWHYEGDAVILANGSCASNISGADGSGYKLAEALGHPIIKPLPALTALKCKGKAYSGWAGVRIEGSASLFINGEFCCRESGELQLTEYGISGIPIFQLSRYAIRALDERKQVSVTLDFLPEMSTEDFHIYLEKRRKNCPYKNEKALLVGLFPEKLIKILCSRPNIEEAVKNFSLEISSGMSFEQAQVCSGGVCVDEINFETLESKIQKGLFFAGELLDIDGICGGYNLQWAWSTGAVAGLHAAKETK